MMATAPAPTPATLQAFGLSGEVTPLAGGRGLCYRVGGGVVVRPSDDAAESQWLAQISAALLSRSPTAYRLAVPIPSVANPDVFVVDGWTASTFISGGISVRRIPELLRAARALHQDLAEMVPECPPAVRGRKRNRFDEADRVTWDDKALGDVEGVDMDMLAHLRPILDRLEAVMQPLPTDDDDDEKIQRLIRPQLVHMDLLGNVLFDDEEGGNPPGIIDLTFYWRPALYAEAVVVADGLAWGGGDLGSGLADSYVDDMSQSADAESTSTTRDIRLQLLIRALYWRYLTFAIDPDLEWIRANLPRADYAGAAEIVRRLAGTG